MLKWRETDTTIRQKTYMTVSFVRQDDIPSVGPINQITQSVKEQASNEDPHYSQILQRCCCCCHLVQRRGETERLFTHLWLQITQITSFLRKPALTHDFDSCLGFNQALVLFPQRIRISVPKLLHVNTPPPRRR